MATCTTCQSYFRQSPYNNTDQCDSCAYTSSAPQFDDEDALEVEHLLHPSGKTPARFYE